MTDSAADQIGQIEAGRLSVADSLAKSRIFQRLRSLAIYDRATAVVILVLVVLALATFKVYSVTNDEGLQREYGELIIAYYKSGFTDQRAFHFVNLYLYGGLFDIVAGLLNRVVPLLPYDLRHILCAMVGIGGIVAASATARLIAGPRAGFFTALALALCGSWYGTMFHHTKDIPLAAAIAGANYFLLRAARDLPRPRWRDILAFGVMTGAALGMKVLALLLVGYVGVIILINTPRPLAGHWNERARFVATSLVRFGPGLVIAYLIMITAWPWAALAPLNPIRGLIDFSEFSYHIRAPFMGIIYEMATVPRIYVPAYILIRIPLLTLSGVALALILAMTPRLARAAAMTRQRQREIAFVAFTLFFPLACQVIMRGPAFTGLRHFLFVVPPIAVLAGIGFDGVLTLCAGIRRAALTIASAILGIGFFWNAVDLYRLHPYEYMAYNSIVGGPKGAGRNYAGDYWVTILPEAMNVLKDYLRRTEPAGSAAQTYYVAVCGERAAFEQYMTPHLRWMPNPDWHYADFYIAPRHMNCDAELPGTIIGQIIREGAILGVVKDRRATRTPGYQPEN